MEVERSLGARATRPPRRAAARDCRRAGAGPHPDPLPRGEGCFTSRRRWSGPGAGRSPALPRARGCAGGLRGRWRRASGCACRRSSASSSIVATGDPAEHRPHVTRLVVCWHSPSEECPPPTLLDGALPRYPGIRRCNGRGDGTGAVTFSSCVVTGAATHGGRHLRQLPCNHVRRRHGAVTFSSPMRC